MATSLPDSTNCFFAANSRDLTGSMISESSLRAFIKLACLSSTRDCTCCTRSFVAMRNAFAAFCSGAVGLRPRAEVNICSIRLSSAIPPRRSAQLRAASVTNGSFIIVRDCAGTLEASRTPCVLLGTGASNTLKNGSSALRITLTYTLLRPLLPSAGGPKESRPRSPDTARILSRMASASSRRTDQWESN